MNRTLCDRAQGMLSHSCVSNDFLAEAINTTCYLVNKSSSTSIVFKTPFEVWSSSPVDYSNLTIFGCPSYAHVSDGKLEPTEKKCLFLGYATGVKGYKLWCTDQKTPGLIISRDITCNESASLDSQREKAIAETDRGVSDRIELEIESLLAQPSSSKVEEV
ncbi:putative mitochondrial protein AtMg00710 [Nicotiana tabacum]|uniref:Mitochondrial protein AtMg00710 n=1 Tax=Nicotiana tabacum TaxID=4097 RepID=A0AC58UQ53_TOBAC